MAALDYTRLGKNSEKKSVSVTSGSLAPTATDSLVVADVITLAKLPANSVVINAFIVVKTGATTGTQTLALKIGATAVIPAVAVGTASGAVVGGTVTRVHTGTGANLTATVAVGNLVDGEFEVVVEYIEYTKSCGELTQIN